MFNEPERIKANYLAAIYIRLSKEDIKENGKEDESESIQNQKTLLTKYVNDQGYSLVDIYIDDGYTGTNFNRPSFQRMLKDIEEKKINMVITKDLSRLSRDYIGTGEYVEKWFPAHGIRYIALTDAIDTAIDSANNDIAPFKAILNDMYAKDLSKKIKTALHTMQAEGKWVGGCPPFGYKVDPQDKNHLVIDKTEGPIIKYIFSLFIRGYKINQIKDLLNQKRIPTFTLTRKRSKGHTQSYWSNTTIKKILQNRLYTGDMIQNRRRRINYKYRKIICNPQEEWIIVENTHEALIDKKKFTKVQELLPKQRQRNDKKDTFLLDGLLKCADCNHNIGIRTRRTNGKTTTVCNYYRKYKAQNHLCTSHGFDYDSLEKGILDILRELMNSLPIEKIASSLQKSYHQDNPKEKIMRTIHKLETDINTLKNSLDNMYIDKLSHKITSEMYDRISFKITQDITLKENNLKKNQNALKHIKESNADIKKLYITIEEFINIKYPPRNLILSLIKQIAIHEDGNIDIYFNFKELNLI